MAISIGDFARERRDLVYNTAVGDLKLTYAPNVLTPSDEAKLVSARDEGSVAVYREILEQLCKVIVSWDLEGPLHNADTGEVIIEPGEVVPLQPDILQHMPSAFMTGLYRVIGEDNVPKASHKDRQTRASSPTASGSLYQGSFG